MSAGAPLPPPPAARTGGPRLPRGVRVAALLCFVLASLTLFRSLQDLVLLAHLQEVRDWVNSPQAAQQRDSGMDPEVERRTLEAQLSALEPMREPRAIVLVGLAAACFLCIGASGHLLRRSGLLPREGMRLLLGRAGLAAAFLRTVDGAQSAVVWRRMGAAGAEVLERLPGMDALAQSPERLQQLREALPTSFAVAAMLYTLLVAGLFLLLAQYFRSERVRALVAAQEPQLRRDG